MLVRLAALTPLGEILLVFSVSFSASAQGGCGWDPLAIGALEKEIQALEWLGRKKQISDPMFFVSLAS